MKHRITAGITLSLLSLVTALAGCKPSTAPPVAPPKAMPVMVAPVTLIAVPTDDTYVATVKSRRSATISPQVDGKITRIYVTAGQSVRAGQVLMQIDPLKQAAAVRQQAGVEAQSNASYQFNKAEVDRQKKLFEAGITSKQVYDTAVQNFESSKASYDANVAGTTSQRAQLGYYQITSPFSGVVGDIPVHVGDYVTPNGGLSTLLTTVNDPAGLEAYIYLPTDRAAEVKMGLPVDILDTMGMVVTKSKITFVSPQVDNGLQGILVKAEIPNGTKIRNEQIVNARVTWSMAPKPTIPVLAVTQIGGQAFVYIAAARGEGYMAHQVPVKLGETIGNMYPVLDGLKEGDQVIVSGLQMIGEGAPVQPMHGPAGPPKS